MQRNEGEWYTSMSLFLYASYTIPHSLNKIWLHPWFDNWYPLISICQMLEMISRKYLFTSQGEIVYPSHRASLCSSQESHKIAHAPDHFQTTQWVSRKCPDTISPTNVNGLLSNVKVKVDSTFGVVAALQAGFIIYEGTNIIRRTSHKPNFSSIGPTAAEIWPQVPRVQVLIGRSPYIQFFMNMRYQYNHEN